MSTSVELTAALLRVRAREVVGYLRFLELALENDSFIDSKRANRRLVLAKRVTHTLKANLYLLLYSAMEATLVQLLDEMHDAIGKNCKGVDQLNRRLLMAITQHFKQRKGGLERLDIKAPFHETLFSVWIKDWQALTKAKDKRTSSISGNVDSRAIADQLRRFGVVDNDEEKAPSHLSSEALLKAKNRRNQLAHGERSFAEMGRELGFEELKNDAKNVFKILSAVMKDVDEFLQNRRYLADPQSASAPATCVTRATTSIVDAPAATIEA
ncbi:MAG: MAE_28990/MAE_18760 family HEPN-like nuclease [Xylophilus ampelinus]